MRYPVLSFIELQRLAPLLNTALRGARIDRIFIPECTYHPQGFFKNEWVLETRHSQILLSLRAQACSLTVHPPKTFRSAKAGTRSGFDLGLSKTIEGQRLERIETINGERILMLTFSDTSTLTLFLIPARPRGELNLKEKPPERSVSESELAKIPDRVELTQNLDAYSKQWLKCRRDEAANLHTLKFKASLEQTIQSLKKKQHSLLQQLEQSRNEPDWNYFGSILQMNLYLNPEPMDNRYLLEDFETGKRVEIPADSKLKAKAQLEKFFHQAKRKKKKIEEAELRLLEIGRLLKIEHEKLRKVDSGEFNASELNTTDKKIKVPSKATSFAGRSYLSKEGLTILSGRSKEENLELTFKVARGNDLWLHVKGRPGSHTVILLPPGKSASLESLLDAANLCILHSGGKDWGKTEVDYTQRKNVKKIKNQTEVSYSGNKTLVVAVDPERIKRLYQD